MKIRIICRICLILSICPLICKGQQAGKDTPSAGGALPAKKLAEIQFKHQSFAFVRIKYSGPMARFSMWSTDYPDGDLNFSARFQKETGLKTDPEGKVLELTDPKLKDYPFIYIVEGGDMRLSPAEVQSLREYLLRGGFLMVDDFWGKAQWKSFYEQIKKVFPDREPVELSIDHPIFHCVFDLKEKPQVPAVGWAVRGRPNGITWEYHDGEECREVHYKGVFDDKDRMMVVICHNTDLGDAWEREGADEWFSREFAEKKAYPMGINIVVYALTH
jgi:hypothetical protein